MERKSVFNKKIVVIFLKIAISLIIAALLTIVPLWLWIASGVETFGITSIRGDSMAPTIDNNAIVYYQPTKFERGEIVIVNCPNTKEYTEVSGVQLLKRIVGLPGETVEITKDGVLINGILLEESYIDNKDETMQESNAINEVVLSDGEYFVLGDNRATSFDSRHVGPIHQTEFLYGLTTNPNPYTKNVFMKASIIAVINVLILFFMLWMFWRKRDDTKSKTHVTQTENHNTKTKPVLQQNVKIEINTEATVKSSKKSKGQPKSKLIIKESQVL